MGGVTSNCSKNYSFRQKYFEKYPTPTTTTTASTATAATATSQSNDNEALTGKIASAVQHSNNNKPDVRGGGATGSRNRSASVGDEVSERGPKMINNNRRPLEGSRNVDTSSSSSGGGTERRPQDYVGKESPVVRPMTAAGSSIGAATRTISGPGGSWGASASRAAGGGSRTGSWRSDASTRGSPNRRIDSPGSGSDVTFNTGSRFAPVDPVGGGGGGRAIQRSSDTRLELTGSDVTSVAAVSGGSVRISSAAAPPRGRTQRRSSISSFLPAEATTTMTSPVLGLFPGTVVRSGTSMASSAFPMDKVSIGFGTASDLVASLIGSATGSGSSSPGQPKQQEGNSFWVPQTLWRKKRALSLVPQKPSTEGETAHEGVRVVRSASNSMQEMSIECPPGSEPGTASPPVSGGQSTSDGQLLHQQQQQQQQQMQQGGGGGGGGRRRRASMQDALDFSKFNASLYERPPLVSEKQFGSIQEENCGSINLSIGYETELSLLTVRVIRAQDLAAPSPRPGGCPSVDSYCRICLLPNRRRQFHTKVQRRTTNPEYDEEFVFDVTQKELGDAALELAVLDGSEGAVVGGDTGNCLGVVHLPIYELNLAERVWLWKGISPFVRENEKDGVGELMFSMTYLSSAERLTVVVSKARNLRHTDDSKNSAVNPFVRVALLSGGKRTKKKRTSTKRNALNPVWNEALVFCLQGKEQLGAIHLEVGVFTDNYLLGNNELIGKVILGSENITGDCRTHWIELINNKNAPARWHRLQTPAEH